MSTPNTTNNIPSHLEDITLADLEAADDMLKESLGVVTGWEGEKLDIEWARIGLEALESDIHIEEL